MSLSRTTRTVLLLLSAVVLLFIYAPLALVLLNSFNTSRTFAWPPAGYTTQWWSAAVDNPGARNAIVVSLEVALMATAVALVLGTMAALALQRFRFFGRDTISLLVILPIALPGVVTGIALANAFLTMFGIQLGLFSLVVSHATFCMVTVFNNAIARLRRLGGNLEEASMDLGAGTFRTFASVTLPMMRSALLAGALLSFALSFDEIIVTTFTAGSGVQTLPIWIYQNLFRPNQAPVVNVVAAALIVLSIIPIWLSQRLAGTDESVAAAR
jgi:putative spermidine/putrescine transport system permease protein